MFKQKSLVVYKNKSAIVKEISDKIVIELQDKSIVRVREKDIELLYEGPCEGVKDISFSDEAAKEIWELVCGEERAFTLAEIAELADNGISAQNIWSSYLMLLDGLYFEGQINEIKAKTQQNVEDTEKKRNVKQNVEQERIAFLQRLKTNSLDLPEDGRFLQDIEALALGNSEKSRTMHEIGLSDDPIAAHKLLLDTGFWDKTINPHPSRYGVVLFQPKTTIDGPAADEKRFDLTSLDAFAIDDEGSLDPDDAISFEATDEGDFLYVHVADPAVIPGSPADLEARARGATFYAPENTVRMLNEDSISKFALGLSEFSNALTFKIKLKIDPKNISIENTKIFLSKIKVTRLTYKEATEDKPELKSLFDIAQRNLKRRIAQGAVQIDFPEAHIYVNDGKVRIEIIENYSSRSLVRECMLLAGEAAANWALENRLPFPYISQETENPPNNLPDANTYALSYQLRRTMRARVLGVKPALHQGLGLDIYTQVTSPLRRYTDLLAHQQIRAFLKGKTFLSEDEVLTRIAASDRAASAVSRAERNSRAHWTTVYLSEKIAENNDYETEGIILDIKGPHAVVLLTQLCIETQTALTDSDLKPNDKVKLKLKRTNISESQSFWTIKT